VLLGDLAGAHPSDERLLDFFAIWVRANATLVLVTPLVSSVKISAFGAHLSQD